MLIHWLANKQHKIGGGARININVGAGLRDNHCAGSFFSADQETEYRDAK